MPILLNHKRTLSDSNRDKSLIKKQHKKTISLVNEKLFPDGFFASSSKKRKAVDRLKTTGAESNRSDKKPETKLCHNIRIQEAAVKSKNINKVAHNDTYKINLFVKQKKKTMKLEPKAEITDLNDMKQELQPLGVKKRRILSPNVLPLKTKLPGDINKAYGKMKFNLHALKDKSKNWDKLNSGCGKSRLPSCQTPSKSFYDTTLECDATKRSKASASKNCNAKVVLPTGSAYKKLSYLTQKMNSRQKPESQGKKAVLDPGKIAANLKRHMKSYSKDKSRTQLSNAHEISLTENFSFRPRNSVQFKLKNNKLLLLNDYSKLSNGADLSQLNCFKTKGTNKPIVPSLFKKKA